MPYSDFDEKTLWYSYGTNHDTKYQRVTTTPDTNNNIVQNPSMGLSRFMTSSVTDMKDMFSGTTKLFVSLREWDVRNVDDNANFKDDNNHITPPVFNKVNRYSRSNLLKVRYYMFTDPNNYASTYGHVREWVLSTSITSLSELTNVDLLQKHVGIYEHETILRANIKLFNESLSDWDVSHVIDFSNMLKGCEDFDNGGEKLSEHWNVQAGVNLSYMFDGCLVYLDDITPFMKLPVADPYAFWANAATGSSNVYFTPSPVENLKLSTVSANTYTITWDKPSYYPISSSTNNVNIKYTVETDTITGVTSDSKIDIIIPIVDRDGGEIKISVYSQSCINAVWSEKSSKISIDVHISTLDGVSSITSTDTFVKTFAGPDSTILYEWKYTICTTVSDSNPNQTKLLNTEIKESDNDAVENLYGMSIDFKEGSMISYIRFDYNTKNASLILNNSYHCLRVLVLR